KEARYIVRIANKDVDGNLPIARALQGIKGIGQRFSQVLAYLFEKETGIPAQTKIGLIPEDADKKLENIVLNSHTYPIPKWMLNRRNDWETGETSHLVMNDLQFSWRKDIQMMQQIKSYKGIRHSIGQPVRGQRTKSSFRKRGTIVGVQKKDNKPATAGKK
ncbi:MAG: 30S ribosomal protein S13, partial [Candidatus Diapherotrites archaeon]|nr:30S ribosomal protein S13 [Candidatus Diapherotrites archaeon]